MAAETQPFFFISKSRCIRAIRRKSLLALLAMAGRIVVGMEEVFKQWTFYLAAGVEAGAAVVIGIAAIEATIGSLILFFRGSTQSAKEQIRLRLGRWLAVALELELAADILRTAIAPTWNEIGQLAAIVVLRTVLNFFLQREIDKAEKREPGSAQKSTRIDDVPEKAA